MINFYLSDDPVHNRVIRAFYEGCSADKKLITGFKYEPSETAVVFGVYKSKVPKSKGRGEVIRQQREKNLDVVVLETGYVNRGDGEDHHYAAGFNGLNGRADFKNKGMTSERWDMLNIPLKPYSTGGHILLCGQVPWDASVEGTNHVMWLERMGEYLLTHTTKPIIFRPHPLAATPPLAYCDYSQCPLEWDLQRAHAVVTFNSNSGVEAAIYGKPVFVFDTGSMCWDIANKDIKNIDNPQHPDRAQWAYDLAYTQWTIPEMEKGLAWRHLLR